jgi:hypothetical protein
MAKPVGTNGPFVVQVNPDGTVTGSFMPITMPGTKVEIEQCVADRFIASMDQHLAQAGERFFLSDPVASKENDFDFTVQSPRGDAFLELMEIAPLQGPYDTAPARYEVYGFARAIFQGILTKSERYPKQMTNDLFLLVYVTHWAFALGEPVIACLRYWCARTPLVFRAVFSFQSLDETEGTPGWLFPVPPDLVGSFDPEKVRGATWLNLDPRKWSVSRGDMA